MAAQDRPKYSLLGLFYFQNFHLKLQNSFGHLLCTRLFPTCLSPTRLKLLTPTSCGYPLLWSSSFVDDHGLPRSINTDSFDDVLSLESSHTGPFGDVL